MLDKTGFVPNITFTHQNRGTVTFTEDCYQMELKEGVPGELFVRHPTDGIIAVSLSLLTIQINPKLVRE